MDDNSKNNLNGKFATCLNCIDGRIQLPVLRWIMDNYQIDYVDMITEPGMDGFLTQTGADLTKIYQKIKITIDIHDSEDIFIVAHDDCAGNPVDYETHKNQIHHAANLVKEFSPECRVIGIWVDLNGNIEKIVEK